MTSGGGSWKRVAAGLRMVARAAAARTRDDATHQAARAARHGAEVAASAARTAALAALQQQQQQRFSPAAAVPQPSHWNGLYHNKNSMANNGVDGLNGLAKSVTSAPPNLDSVVPTPPPSSATMPAMDDQHNSASAVVSREVPMPEAPQPPQHEPQQTRDNLAPENQTIRRAPPPAQHGSSGAVVAPENQILPPSSSSSASHAHQPIFSSTQNRPPPTIHEKEHVPHRIREERAVPSTRLGRALGFANLGLGLAWGSVAEGASRLLGGGGSSDSNSRSVWINDQNSDRLAVSLCRMRGAALKMGQMLSIQDEALLPPPLVRALRQVRQGAEAMPRRQLQRQLENQLGQDWRDRFVRFDQLPTAAASIGQVHRASILDEATGTVRDVVVKVQYPGVARSIESDLNNLAMLVTVTGLAPKGLFIENVIRVGQEELKVECDYLREKDNQMRIKALVEADPVLRENRFVVPDVIEHLTTEEIITSEYLPGGTIDKIAQSADQEEKNRIGRTVLYLTMKELFDWRFMQTDPNWGNFLYDVGTRTTGLIDFGAAREYSKEFVDGYLRIVWASANRDEETLMRQSHRMGFLTGDENDAMLRAHKLSGFTVGEPFWEDKPFDFRGSSISERMGEHTSVFLRHRLTPPPEEVYTLHRKLAGAYMLCIKLGAVVRCRDMLHNIVANHHFEDGENPIT